MSEAFICDLRNQDSDAIAASIMASNLAEAMWEHCLFLMSRRDAQQSPLNWGIYVIGVSGELHILARDTEFTFHSVKSALANLACGTLPDPTTIAADQDPLSASIDFCSLGLTQTIYVFITSPIAWESDIEKTIRRVQLAGTTQVDFNVIVVSDDSTGSELAQQIADQHIVNVIQIANRDDSFFQLFRSLTEPSILHPIREILAVGAFEILSEKAPLFLNETQIESTTVCRCHNLPVSQKVIINCPVSAKRITQTTEEYSLGGLPISFSANEFASPRMVAQCRIASAQISESVLFGGDWIYQSGDPKFHRLLNELRCHKEAMLAKKNTTTLLGGEFWVLVADPVAPVIHAKRIANRTQVLRIDVPGIDLTGDIWTTPILPELPVVAEISPVMLGQQDLRDQFA
jgi:hypothetical protein